MSSGRLGELLVREKLITPLQLQEAMQEQRAGGGRLGYQLTKMGFIEENELTAFLSKQYGVPSIDLSDFDIEPDIIKLIPKEVVLKHQVIPINRTGSTLIVARCGSTAFYQLHQIY